MLIPHPISSERQSHHPSILELSRNSNFHIIPVAYKTLYVIQALAVEAVNQAVPKHAVRRVFFTPVFCMGLCPVHGTMQPALRDAKISLHESPDIIAQSLAVPQTHTHPLTHTHTLIVKRYCLRGLVSLTLTLTRRLVRCLLTASRMFLQDKDSTRG